MKGSIDRANKPVNDSIAWLYQSIKGLEVKRTLIADSLQKVDYLYSVFLPKIKDKELVGEFLSYFTDVFEKSPDAGVLALAKEKDFTKACKSKDFEEATAKLLAKTKEKALKDISKGKMEALFVYDTICVRRQRYNDALSNIAQSVSYQKDAIALLEAKLKPVPPFGRKQFIETTGSEDFPLKELILSADAFGPEYRTYRELAEQYPKMAAESITGKFDGIIEDRLAIFPYGIKCNVGSYEIDAFFTMILKSEKGTVPDLILDAQKLHLNDGDNDSEEVYGRPLFGIYDEMHNLKLIPFFAVWDRKEKSSIGVVVKYYPMEPLTDALQESRVSTFVVNDGQWVNKPPFDSKYLTYSQCRDLWADLYEERKIDATPFSFNWKAEDGGYNGKSSDLISFPGGSPEDYAHGVPANFEMVFKSPDLPDLVVPGHGIAGWNVEKNFFGTGKDALILKYGLSQDEGGSYIDVYGIEWDGPFWAYINGNDEHSDLAWTKWYTIIKDTCWLN